MPYQPPEHPALLLAFVLVLAIITGLLLWFSIREAEGKPRVMDTDPEDPMP